MTIHDYGEHNPKDHEDPSAAPAWGIGLVGVVLTVVTVIGITAFLHSEEFAEEEEKIIAAGTRRLQALRAQQEVRLAAPPHWEIRLDGGGEPVRSLVIPVETAIDRWLAEHGEGRL